MSDAPHKLQSQAKRAHKKGKYRDAELLLKQALSNKKERLAIEIAEILRDLGLVYQSQSRHAEARQYFESCLAIEETALGPQHSEAVRTRSVLEALYNASPNLSRDPAKSITLEPEGAEVRKTVEAISALYSTPSVAAPADTAPTSLDLTQKTSPNVVVGRGVGQHSTRRDPGAEAGVGEENLAKVSGPSRKSERIFSQGFPTVPTRQHWLLLPLIDRVSLSGSQLRDEYVTLTGDEIIEQIVYKGLVAAHRKKWVTCKQGNDARTNAYALTKAGRRELERALQSVEQADRANALFASVLRRKL